MTLIDQWLRQKLQLESGSVSNFIWKPLKLGRVWDQSLQTSREASFAAAVPAMIALLFAKWNAKMGLFCWEYQNYCPSWQFWREIQKQSSSHEWIINESFAHVDLSVLVLIFAANELLFFYSTEGGTRPDTRFCHKFSWEFNRLMGLTTAAVQPGKEWIK